MSQKEIFKKYNFEILKNYLSNESNDNWAFIDASEEVGKFRSVPTYSEKYKLGIIRCELKYQEKSQSELLFRFTYCGISLTINLLNRELSWIKEYKVQNKITSIYPAHFESKYQNRYSDEII